MSSNIVPQRRQRPDTLWHRSLAWIRDFAHDSDPLVEASNWVALLIGTHLPFWPLYVWYAAGAQAMPSALLTMAMAPIFLAIPALSRRSGLLGRVAMLLAGITNAVFTTWILGANSGTELFLAPCAVLAALSFRQHERWLMLSFTACPLLVWYFLQHHPLTAVHHYDDASAKSLVFLNLISVTVLTAAFGWLLADVYRRLERR